MNELTRDEVSVHIDATPEQVYDLVADVTRMPEWSPELLRCEWLDGAAGPAVGARFRAVNQIGKAKFTNKPTVVVAERGREFAVSRVEAIGGELIWRYRLSPGEGGGTLLRESYEVVRPPTWFLRVVIMRGLQGITDRATDIRAGMQTTLERLKLCAERR